MFGTEVVSVLIVDLPFLKKIFILCNVSRSQFYVLLFMVIKLTALMKKVYLYSTFRLYIIVVV